jgi:hypothetical protein
MKRIGVMLAALCCLALPGNLWAKKTTSNDRTTVVRPKPPKPAKRPKVQRDSKGRIVQSSWRKPKKSQTCASTGAAGPCPGMPVEPAMPKPYKVAKTPRGKTPPPQARPIQPAPPSQQPTPPPAANGSEAKEPAPAQ